MTGRQERFAMRGDNDQLASFWMPFTANRAFKANPRQIVSASGMFYQSADGRTILDGTSGLWCSNAGHCRPEISEAIAKAAATLDFAPTFQLGRSEEHTSELQSLMRISYAVFCLKKTTKHK